MTDPTPCGACGSDRTMRAHYELGCALFAQEQGSVALRHLETACRLRPAWAEAHLVRAFELHWEERWIEAQYAYATVARLGPLNAAARQGLTATRQWSPPQWTNEDGVWRSS